MKCIGNSTYGTVGRRRIPEAFRLEILFAYVGTQPGHEDVQIVLGEIHLLFLLIVLLFYKMIAQMKLIMLDFLRKDIAFF